MSAGEDNNNYGASQPPSVSSTSSARENASRIPGPSRDNDNSYCGSLRRARKIAPFFGRHGSPEAVKKERKEKKKKSPIHFRAIPGRSFDGFLGRFVKRRIIGEGRVEGLVPTRKHTPTSPMAAALKHKFTSKVSPLPQDHRQSMRPDQGIAFHDPPVDPLMCSDSSAPDNGDEQQRRKPNLLHTIKIYLHGNQHANKTTAAGISGVVDAIDVDCCNSIPDDSDSGGQPPQPVKNNCDKPESKAHQQLFASTGPGRRRNFSLGSPNNSIIRDSVNTSLSIFCSAAGGRAITEVALESAPKDTENANGKLTTKVSESRSRALLIESMSSSPASVQPLAGIENANDLEDTFLESLEDPLLDDTVVNLEAEFREVLHFNIGQSVRTPPPPTLRGNLLRHVTSFESYDETVIASGAGGGPGGSEETEASSTSFASEKDRGDAARGGEEEHKNLCVDKEQPRHRQSVRVNKRKRQRLIHFYNLQDSTGNGEGLGAPTEDSSAAAITANNVRSSLASQSFKSLDAEEEERFYSGAGFTQEELLSTSGASGGGSSGGCVSNSDCPAMPAHGDLLFIDQLDNSDMTMQNSPKMASAVGKKEHLYKILVIGELGTGKTSFIKRYVHQFFSSNYRATIGVDFALKVIPWDEQTLVRLQLWDIAGQERFGNMTRVYYKEAVGAFIVFDVTRQATFEAVKKWKQDLDSKVQLPDGSPIPCMLLANKCDQEKQGSCSDANTMDEFVKENNFVGWFETSAKDNINIDESAKGLVSQILLNDQQINQEEVDNERIVVARQDDQQNSKKCSC